MCVYTLCKHTRTLLTMQAMTSYDGQSNALFFKMGPIGVQSF